MVLLLCRASHGLRCTARLTRFRAGLQAFRKGPKALAKLLDDFTEDGWLGRYFSGDAVENLVYAIVYGEEWNRTADENDKKFSSGELSCPLMCLSAVC